jgi:hypothetical protein
LALCVDIEGESRLKVNIPSIEWLANHLELHRDTIHQWEKEEGKEDFSDILRELRNEQAKRLINNGLSGAYNPTIAKLILSKHWYVEKTENKDTLIVATPDDLNKMTDEELLKYVTQ